MILNPGLTLENEYSTPTPTGVPQPNPMIAKIMQEQQARSYKSTQEQSTQTDATTEISQSETVAAAAKK